MEINLTDIYLIIGQKEVELFQSQKENKNFLTRLTELEKSLSSSQIELKKLRETKLILEKSNQALGNQNIKLDQALTQKTQENEKTLNDLQQELSLCQEENRNLNNRLQESSQKRKIRKNKKAKENG